MALNLVAGNTAGDWAANRCKILAFATASLVTKQAARSSANHTARDAMRILDLASAVNGFVVSLGASLRWRDNHQAGQNQSGESNGRAMHGITPLGSRTLRADESMRVYPVSMRFASHRGQSLNRT